MAVLGALGVAACGEMTPEQQAQSDATFACMERTSAVFPVLAQMSDTGDEEPAEASDDVKVDAGGGFVMTWEVRGKSRPLPDEFKCRGNLTGRIIETVELNGVTKRPNPSEIWKY
jgi:hypothetical protein